MLKLSEHLPNENLYEEVNIEEYKILGFFNAPRFLAKTNKVLFYLVFHCLFTIIITSLTGTVIPVVNVKTLDKRFELSHTESEVIIATFDIAFCASVLFITFFGQRCNRAKTVSAGCALYGLGAFVYSLPHFVTGLHQYGGRILEAKCIPAFEPDCVEYNRDDHKYFPLFIVGQILMGVGAAPVLTLGLTYIYDSVTWKKSSLYLGIGNGMMHFGPFVGILAGGKLISDYYIDLDKTTPDIPDYDRRYLGPWWIYPLISTGCCWILFFFPLSGFPKHLAGSIGSSRSQICEAQKTKFLQDFDDTDPESSLKDFLQALITALTNPILICITLSGCMQVLLQTGIDDFLITYFINAFSLDQPNASIYTSIILLVAGVAGNILGGIILSTFEMKVPAILKFCAVTVLVCAALSPCYLASCDNAKIAGVTSPYSLKENITMNLELSNPCNAGCNCKKEYFIPVCGTDNITYFSPCFAGCTSAVAPYTYGDCACVAANIEQTTTTRPWAEAFSCVSEGCSEFQWIFFVFCLLLLTCSYLVFTPLMIASIRVVPYSLRSFAVGFLLCLYRALGKIPGDDLFNVFLNKTCLEWQIDQCNGKTLSCSVYENGPMGLTLTLISVCANVVGAIFILFALYFYKPTNMNYNNMEEHNGTFNQMKEIENNEEYDTPL